MYCKLRRIVGSCKLLYIVMRGGCAKVEPYSRRWHSEMFYSRIYNDDKLFNAQEITKITIASTRLRSPASQRAPEVVSLYLTLEKSLPSPIWHESLHSSFRHVYFFPVVRDMHPRNIIHIIADRPKLMLEVLALWKLHPELLFSVMALARERVAG